MDPLGVKFGALQIGRSPGLSDRIDAMVDLWMPGVRRRTSNSRAFSRRSLTLT